jgi:hypothetical protein
VRRRHRRVHPPLLVEEPFVLRVVHPSEDPGDAELLLGEQRGHQVVLVVTGGGDHDVRRPHVGLLQDARLASVAVHDPGVRRPVAELLRQVPALLHQRDVVPTLGQILGEVPTHRAAAGDDHPHPCCSSAAIRSSTRSRPSFVIIRIR